MTERTGLVERIAAQVLQDVCELGDYTSPDDQPNLLQCTTDELDLIVRRALETHLARPDSPVKGSEAVDDGLVSVPIELVRFLLGAGEYDGVWFNDHRDATRPAYWWRKPLAAALPNTSVGQGD